MGASGRFQSEGRRIAAVAAAMVSLLCVSLGLAMAFVRWHPVQGMPRGLGSMRQEIEGLEFTLPRGWAELATVRSRDAEHATPLRVFGDPHNPGRHLVVTVITFAAPRAPVVALGLALHDRPARKTSDAELSESARPFRAGTMVGLRHVSMMRGGDQEQHLAVMTEDGRRYWVFMLRADADESSTGTPEEAEAASALLEKVCRSAHDLGHRDALGSDFEAVGLTSGGKPIAPPGTLTARVSTDDAGDPPIVLVPSDAQPRLRLLRARMTAEVGGDDASMTRARALLSAQFRHTMSRGPEADELAEEPVAERRALRVTYAMTVRDMPDSSAKALATGGVQPGVVRQLWYVPLGDNRAALIESVGEPTVSKRSGEDAAALVALLAPVAEKAEKKPEKTEKRTEPSEKESEKSDAGAALGEPASSKTGPDAPTGDGSPVASTPATAPAAPDVAIGVPPEAPGSTVSVVAPALTIARPDGGRWAWAAALKAGQRLAERVRQSGGAGLPEGLSFLNILRDARPVGCQVTYVAPPGEGAAPRKGWTALRFAEGRSRINTQWSLNPDGEFTYTLTEFGSPDDDEPDTWALQSRDHMLRVDVGQGSSATPRWRMRMPEAFVPPMLEDALAGESVEVPALVWMSVVREPPAPFLVYRPALRPAGGDGLVGAWSKSASPPAQPRLMVRPVMVMDADAIWADSQGQMERTDVHVNSGSPSGPVRLKIRRADRGELVHAFPELEPKIKAWEKDPSKP